LGNGDSFYNSAHPLNVSTRRKNQLGKSSRQVVLMQLNSNAFGTGLAKQSMTFSDRVGIKY
jgi:hypothetical protein